MSKFMEHQVTDRQWWIELDGTHGITAVPYDVLSKEQIDFAESCTELPETDEEIHSLERINDELGEYYDGTIQSVDCRQGFGARLSAPGYMDCTEWSVFDTAKQAQEYLDENYPEDEEDFEDEEESE